MKRISRNIFLILFWGFASLAELVSASGNTPNILLILSDDHTAVHLGCYGDVNLNTPNLDKLAAEGMRCTRMYTTASQCVPSRASLMTGRSAVDIRMTRFSAPLPRDILTYPECLKKAGYYTGLCGRSYHLDGSQWMPKATKNVLNQYNLRTFQDRVDWIGPEDFSQNASHLETFLDQIPTSKPFFLQVCYSDPHRKFTAGGYEPNSIAMILPPNLPDTPLVRQDLAGYYGELQRLDEQVGQLLAVLDKQGYRDNTLVVFMGDNGAALLRGKGTLYEWGLHVPLLVRWPSDVQPGSVCENLLSGEDLAPTLLEAAGIVPPKEMTGKSFLNALLGRPFEERKYVFAERGAHGSNLPTGTSPFDLGRCVITKQYKLIYNVLWQLPYEPVDFENSDLWRDLQKRNREGTLEEQFKRVLFAPQRPMFELYDLQTDPYEFTNLAGRPETAAMEKKLKTVLQEWMILNQDYLPLPIPP